MKIKTKDLSIHWSETPVPGTDAAIATHPSYPGPIAYLWYRQTLVDHIEIVDCYTNEHYRRNGVMIRVIDELRQWYPGMTIATQAANEMSKPMLLKAGFVKESLGWLLRPEEPCPMI